MAITISCPNCKQAGEHNEIYRGCMRPCPHCGQLVSVATPEDAPIRLGPTEECLCGRKRDEHGLNFALGYEKVIKPSLAVQFFPIVGLLTGEGVGRREVTFVEGWACEYCCSRVQRIRRWLLAPWLMVPTLWLLCMTPIVLTNQAKPAGQLKNLLIAWGLILMLFIMPSVLLICRLAVGICSQPLKKRFGKGEIVKVRVLEP